MRLRRSGHNLGFSKLLGADFGELYPIGLVEVLMGDTFVHDTSVLVRTAPLVAPSMHPIDLRVHHFYVPNRLTWVDWDDFITGRNEGLTVPTVTFTDGVSPELLIDHLGIMPSANQTINALPFRAYNLIWNTFFRDGDLDSEVSLDSLQIQRVRWSKDYFTAARPWPQAGSAVTIPVDVGNSRVLVDSFRLAMAEQRFGEIRARYGTRYEDYLRMHGVRPRADRLDQPEYLGGGKTVISFSEVLATAEGASTKVGDMAGHGIGTLRTRRYGHFFPEHGYVLSLLSARPRNLYTRVMDRTWVRHTRWDYWQKEVEVLPDQAVLQKEISSDHGNTTDIFGYVGRFDEYRHSHSSVASSFRLGGNEYSWHVGRDFPSAPTLNASFVECAPSNRMFADSNDTALKVMVNHRIRAKRLVRRRSR